VNPIDRVVKRLKSTYRKNHFTEHHGRDPYRVLIGCVLSLRTKDTVSFPATERLFRKADSPAKMIRLRKTTIEKLIYPSGFYRVKAGQILEISRQILERFDGKVPGSIPLLLTLPGVGRKTANLVVTLGFGKPGICVDVHVHRICNRLGWIATGSPDESEQALRELLPGRHWIPLNDLMVRHGQAICRPVSPFCSRCPVEGDCLRVGVERSR
jgi:endonuclease-3